MVYQAKKFVNKLHLMQNKFLKFYNYNREVAEWFKAHAGKACIR